MSTPAPKPLRAALARLKAPFDDSRVDDDLLRHLVSTVYGARAPLFASIVMGAVVTVAAWAMTRANLFAALTLSHFIVGAVRLGLLRRYGEAGGAQATRAATLSLDSQFTLWSSMYAALLGIVFAGVVAVGDREIALPLAVGATVGFPIAFASRNCGRPRLLFWQVVSVVGPVCLAYLTLPISCGPYFAAMLLALGVCALVLGQAGYARIVEHFRINETNRRLASFDTLTGLMNRHAFNNALAAELQGEGSDPANRFAIISVDLDRFKEINDTAGHSVGDAFIVETARRLRAATRPGDVVARLGGDEFVVLARDLPRTGPCAVDLAGRIVDALRQPIEVDGVALPTTASVGVAVYPEHGAQADELMKRSDIALYEAKRSGRGRFGVFDSAMQTRLDDARTLEIEIQSALREDQFEAWFQPIQDMETGNILGYEALARWRHPTRGLVSPDNFIPMAEQSGAIVDIGHTILEKACRAAANWDPKLTVAVNFSPVEFRRPTELVQNVKDTLLRTRLDPSRLFVEITESLMLEDSIETRAAIAQLSSIGVRFSLDDFGAGYSSLSYIQDYPFSKIKIDRKFVDRIDSDTVSAAIIASVCVLAERTQMEIVAEGVETYNQEIALRRMGIRHAQGFLYGRPGPETIKAAPKLRIVVSR